MPLFTPGWLKKAAQLRAIVACIPDSEIKPVPSSMSDMMDAMRAFRRGTISEDEALRRCHEAEVAGASEPRVDRLHEPAEIYGWKIEATLVRWHDKICWFVLVDRPSRMCTDKDLVMLGKVMVALGSDDPLRDQISVGGDVRHLAMVGSPIMFAWPNTGQLLDLHVHPTKRGKEMMRMVPRGTRPSDGYENLDTSLRPEDVLSASRNAPGSDERT